MDEGRLTRQTILVLQQAHWHWLMTGVPGTNGESSNASLEARKRDSVLHCTAINYTAQHG